jgi:uncharacterized protein with PIN domain
VQPWQVTSVPQNAVVSARELERIVHSRSHDAHLRRSKGKAATEDVRRKEMQLREELASETYVKANAKKCPECNMVRR